MTEDYRIIDYGNEDSYEPVVKSEDEFFLDFKTPEYTKDPDVEDENARQYVFGIWIYMSSPRELFDIEIEPVYATSLEKAEEKVKRIFSRYPDIEIALQGVMDPETGKLIPSNGC